MPIRPSIHNRSESRDGIALIVTLAFIVLVSILIVSFIAFSQSNRSATFSYARSIQAQEIAQGGLQDILSDLHSEIVAGSTVYSSNSVSVYVPTTNYTGEPARLGYASELFGNTLSTTNLPSTLVRVSRASQDATPTDLYPALSTAYYSNLSAVNGGAILNRASKANSSTSSINGRYISAARWNKPLLLAATELTTGGSNGLQIPTPFSTNTPDWVYVTRTGSRVCDATADPLSQLKPSNDINQSYTITPGSNPPASPILGRYAYVVYDESALLDVSAVGFPAAATNLISGIPPIGTSTTNNPAGITQMVLGKSYLSDADLIQLPGLNGAGGSSFINTLINMRNGSYPGVITSGATYLQASYNYAQNGFLGFQTSSTGGDNPLISRQDLINFFAMNDTNFNTESATISQALPYLGTFSRTISAPTWTPTTNAPSAGVYNYASNAENSTGAPFTSASPNPNRDLANARFLKAGTVTHYYDDQTSANTATYTVKVGDPLLQTRFSLAKIAWLNQADPNSGTGPAVSSTYGKAIRACFGLQWKAVGAANGGNKCWSYVGSGSVNNGTIETLDQIAAESPPREPNFFELLKASILSGSLGLSPGPAAYNNDNTKPAGAPSYAGVPYTGGVDNLYSQYLAPASSQLPAPLGISDMQIMQIGANIIDQFDADSYPTAIYFAYLGIDNTVDAGVSGTPNHQIFGSTDMVFGDENLPYLFGTSIVTSTMDGQYPTTAGLADWWQPELWNPHQIPNPANTTAKAPPQNFQIQGYGTIKCSWGSNASSSTFGNSYTYKGTISNDIDGQYINFTDTGSTASTVSAFYANPRLLTADTISNVTATPSLTQMQAIPAMHEYNTQVDSYDGTLNHFVGFWSGADQTYNPPNSGNLNVSAEGAPVVSFCLGWLDSNSGFHPYSYLTGIFAYTYGTVAWSQPGDFEGSVDPETTQAESHVYVDPRTQRFSTTAWWESRDNVTQFPNKSHRNGGSGWGYPLASNFKYVSGSYPVVDWEANSTTPLTQTGATASYYSDPDGTTRPGDGVFGNATTGDGMALYMTENFLGTGAGTDGTAAGDTVATSTASYLGTNDKGSSAHGRRPVILNRPFRSVGELSYTFRDLPFKTLDFFSTASADAALLDVFSITDEAKVANSQVSSVVAGQVGLNNALQPVVTAMLSAGSKKDFDTGYNITAADATAVATGIVNQLNPSGATPQPLLNRAGLVTQLGADPITGNGAIRNGNGNGGGFANSWDQNNKAYLEGPVRALADVTNTRTWNLMIDIIAQSGYLSPTATTLNDFIVEGEKRYWLHVAIDRYTGKIVDQQLEPVYE